MFDFYKKRNIFFGLSIALIAFGIIMLCINGVSLDIQFTGGAVLKYSYEGDISAEEVKTVAQNVLGANVTVTETQNLAEGTEKIVLDVANKNGVDAIGQQALKAAFDQNFPDNNLEVSEIFTVNAYIGKEALNKGALAIVLACIFILIYVAIRFKTIYGWSAGVMALVALIHDVSLVFFTFVVFKIPLNDGFIAVMLTILGYSINDTIVIYDRIRENQRIYGLKAGLPALVNSSLNQVLTRTLNTSITTLISIVVVFVVAMMNSLSSIMNFALPMMVGVIVGCYSSIFIASPLWIIWNQYKEKKKKAAELQAAKEREALKQKRKENKKHK